MTRASRWSTVPLRLAGSAACGIAVALVGCYAPDIGDGTLACEPPNDRCPRGFRCTDGLCYRIPPDAGMINVEEDAHPGDGADGTIGTGGHVGSGAGGGTVIGGQGGHGGVTTGGGGATGGPGGVTGGGGLTGGGATGTGGVIGPGGMNGGGGATSTGGKPGTGGVIGTGGATSTGGKTGTGGVIGTGGSPPGVGGARGVGGMPGFGGATSVGGAPGLGGMPAGLGGMPAGMGGTPGMGGDMGKPIGSPCNPNVAGQCGANFCVDGVCCDGPCTGQCQACDVSGSPGHCSFVPSGQPHGTDRSPCPGTAECQAQCTGVSAVCGAFPGGTTACTCTAGLLSGVPGTCNAMGSCQTLGLGGLAICI